MADFRKWFLAFAVVALLSSFAIPASAQNTPSFQCQLNAAVTPTVRAEGLAELVGDILLNCTGGTPTAQAQPVPQANITIFLTAPVTSRITAQDVGNGIQWLETMLIVDEPHSAANPNVPLSFCDTANVSLGVCSLFGVPSPQPPGLGTYDPRIGGNSTTPASGGPTRVNVFQGRYGGVFANNQFQVTFFGVPLDPPGTSGTRVFRITNLRANATFVGVSTTPNPATITANISVNPPNIMAINNPQQTVAFVQRGLVTSVTTATFVQCTAQNPGLAAGDTATFTSQFNFRFTEGFPSSWKEKNIETHVRNLVAPVQYPADVRQDTVGANYFSESGFVVASGMAAPSGTPLGFGPFLSANVNAYPAVRGMPIAGIADFGTRLMIQFASIPGGTQVYVPVFVRITTPGSVNNPNSGFAWLVATPSANGGGPFNFATGGSASGLVQVNGSRATPTATGIAVYEVLLDDPFSLERMDVPITVAYPLNLSNDLPTTGITATANGSFAPLDPTAQAATASVPVPRFTNLLSQLDVFSIRKCSCNILFPFVTNTLGFDTGIAISNTSLNTGTGFPVVSPQTGLVTINYYTGLGTAPAQQTTTSPVLPGHTLAFSLSGGGSHGIDGRAAGFQGYIIAQAQFQYCHAFAFIQAQGSPPNAPGVAEGYLGILLDQPGLWRTGIIGENSAH